MKRSVMLSIAIASLAACSGTETLPPGVDGGARGSDGRVPPPPTDGSTALPDRTIVGWDGDVDCRDGVGDGVVAGELSIDPPTLENLGFVWRVACDDNHTSVVHVRFRASGDAEWRDAMPLFHLENRTFAWSSASDEGAAAPYALGNVHAGSIFDLTADTTYEVELTLSDDDGGGERQTLFVRTRREPVESAAGRRLFAVPGSGGGTGSASDPFRGLRAAADAAMPGDVITLRDGTYTEGATFTRDGTEDAPIVFRGENRSTVVLDAAGTSDWFLVFDDRAYNHLENVTLVHARRSLRADRSVGMVIRDTVMRDFPIGAEGDKTLGPRLAHASNAYVCDNEFLGPEPGLDRDRAGYGPSYDIELGGSGNVVCHNLMTHWWDAITTSDHCYTDKDCYANDIYNNLILYSIDDDIEMDGNTRNSRCMRNRLGSSFDGISVQPAFGGPIYLIRNQIFSSQRSPLKFNPAYGGQDGSSGIVALHNSIANYDRGIHGGTWSNVYFRNNIVYATTGYGVNDTIMDEIDRGFDFDYDSYRFSGVMFRLAFRDSDGTTVSYHDPAEACSRMGSECNGRTFTSRAEEWVNVPEPTEGAGAATVAFEPDAWDFTLAPAAEAIDSALVIPNIDDDYVGAGPDRGALERGAPPPVVGPRR